ncbi:MAG: acetamidase [Clostridium sp. SCN 57-10]|nr:MAG: acetamidase [Clostridium sp. SCN 57-10]
MIRISRDHVTDILDKHNPPAARCASGEEVVFETRDCYDDTVTSPERPLGDRPNGLANPCTGPLYVEGAKKGDILKVEILDIKLRDWGVMRASLTAGAFRGYYKERAVKIFEIKDNKVKIDDKLTLECDTMIGVIGTAPEFHGVMTDTPEAHGGNMDCKKIVTGSTLYLPVNVDGALLSLGDLHARMGDGEVMICGMETAGEVTVRVTVLRDVSLPTPFLSCRGRVMTLCSAQTLDEAGLSAVRRMEDFVRTATGLDALSVGRLMSLLCDMAVCQIVDPLLTMRAEFPLDVLETYGYQLP